MGTGRMGTTWMKGWGRDGCMGEGMSERRMDGNQMVERTDPRRMGGWADRGCMGTEWTKGQEVDAGWINEWSDCFAVQMKPIA